MPILLLPVILALTSVTADREIVSHVQTRGAAQAESATFDPDRPPSWWLDKMQRPCAKIGGRTSC